MSEPQEKPMLTDVFVSGVKRGWGIATGSMLPNVLMAFILIYVLKLTGILDLIGTVCGPVMKIFGLPGEALMVLLAAWLSMGGGVGVPPACLPPAASACMTSPSSPRRCTSWARRCNTSGGCSVSSAPPANTFR